MEKLCTVNLNTTIFPNLPEPQYKLKENVLTRPRIISKENWNLLISIVMLLFYTEFPF